jgi:hypothetical protein
MKMKMKAKYFAKVKTMPGNEETNLEVHLAEEKIPDTGFVYSFFSKIEYAESY